MSNDDKKLKTQRDIWRAMYFLAITMVIISNRRARQNNTVEEEPKQQIEQTFDEGEHIISVPIDNPKKEIQTYEYHDGYKVIDIENKYILYVNDEPVKCIGYLDSDEKVHYIEFGEPISLEDNNTSSKTYRLVPQEQIQTTEED